MNSRPVWAIQWESVSEHKVANNIGFTPWKCYVEENNTLKMWTSMLSIPLEQIFISKGAVGIAQWDDWLGHATSLMEELRSMKQSPRLVWGNGLNIITNNMNTRVSLSCLFMPPVSDRWYLGLVFYFFFSLHLFFGNLSQKHLDLLPEFCLCYLVMDKFSLIGIWKRLKNAWV